MSRLLEDEKFLQNYAIALKRLDEYFTKLGKPPDDFYDNYAKPHIMAILFSAIRKKQRRTEIITSRIFKSFGCYESHQVSMIYVECEDFFWNVCGIDVHFGGFDLGSGVSLCYTRNFHELEHELKEKSCYIDAIGNDIEPTAEDEANLKKKLYQIQLEISANVGMHKQVAVDQLLALESGQTCSFETGICMIGYMFPYFYRQLSDWLEYNHGGKLIKRDGSMHLLKL